MSIIGDVAGKRVIMVDDMIDTGGTICKASKLLKEKGALDIHVFATHGLFSGDAVKNINESGESGSNYAKAYSTSELFTSQRFPVAMRATPTITAYSNSGTAGQVHKLGSPDVGYTSVDRLDVYGGMRFNSSNAWATGDTDMYSFTFQADAEL